MSINEIAATTRDWTGSTAAKKSRLQHHIPAVLVHQGRAQHLALTNAQHFLQLLTHNIDNTFSLKINDQECVAVVLKAVQRHPISLQILHVDFYLAS